MDRDQLPWEQITRVFFRAPAKPSPAETERFVSRVMARIDREETAPAWWEEWLESRWFAPALSLAAVALFFLIVFPRSESVAPMDVLFLLDAQNRDTARLLLPPDPSGGDNMLALAMEEQ